MEQHSSFDSFVRFVNKVIPMPGDEMEKILPILQHRELKKHDLLLREGEVCRYAYFITEGFFRMYYVDEEGNEINYRFANRYNFLVDFQSFLTQHPSHFYWQAMQDSELFALAYHDIQYLYSASHSWNNFGRLMAELVYLQLNERVEMLLFMSPEERYQKLLDSRPELVSQVSQFHLASYLGIKPESLSRLRKRLLKKK